MPISTGLTPSQIDNLVELTLKNFRRDDWVDLTAGFQKYFAMGTMLTGKNVGVEGGEQLQWEIKLSNAGNARNTGLYSQDELNQDMDVVNGKVGWSFQDTHFVYDVREPMIQRGGTALVQKINMLRHGALMDLAELMEVNFWGAPANGTDQAEILKPKGLLYWVVPNATQGFNGQNPTGFSDVAGLDSSNSRYTNWRNWTDTYKAKTFSDLIEKMKLAAYKTDFQSPIPYPEATIGRPQTVIVSTWEVVNEMENLLRAQNDNLGNELAAKSGAVMFKGNTVTPIPYLDTNAGSATAWKKNPVIMLNLKYFGAFFLEGQLMKRTEVTVARQHNVKAVYFDTTSQFRCINRRAQAYIYES